MYLLSYNYVKCLQHGNQLLDLDNEEKPLAKSTVFNVNHYMAEAYCMTGKFTESLQSL